jgi:hypothetical protein
MNILDPIFLIARCSMIFASDLPKVNTHLIAQDFERVLKKFHAQSEILQGGIALKKQAFSTSQKNVRKSIGLGVGT